jgi:hypothetical protein
MNVTENQKRIYNLYLRAFRINNNQPYRAKKNFSDIEQDLEKITYLQKIEKVFEKYPSFFNSFFFDAPYKIYNDEKIFFPLKFYASSKGISTCIAYIKVLQQSNPEEQFEYFKESYKFIANFCESKNIRLEDYSKHCSVAQNDCLIHLKEHKISWYSVFSIPGMYDILYKMPRDEFELYYGSDLDLNKMYNCYKSSIKTQNYLEELKRKISHYLKKKLEQKAIL